MRAFFLLLVGAVAACSRPSSTDSTDAAHAAAPPASSAAIPAASSATAAEDAARHVVASWSDALDRHDLVALERVYAPRVKFYGNELDRSAVVAAKRRALAASPTFHQSIVGAVDVAKDGAAFVTTFTKRSGTTKMQDVKARVVVEGGLVREESDAPSDARRADSGPTAAGPSSDGCEAAASSAVFGLPEVKKLLADDQKEVAKAKDGRNLGGIGPIPEESGGFSASLGVHHPDRYEAHLWYSVDGSGKLSVTVMGGDVEVPAAAQQSVQRACRAK